MPSCSHAGDFAQAQLGRTAGAIAPTAYPKQTDANGAWKTTNLYDWTSGFLPGNFWLAYQLAGASAQRTRAQSWQAGVESRKADTSTHDLGFVIFNSFGNGFRLTGDPGLPAGRARRRDVAGDPLQPGRRVRSGRGTRRATSA